MMQLWQRIRSIDFTACVQMYQVIGSTSFRSDIKKYLSQGTQRENVEFGKYI